MLREAHSAKNAEVRADAGTTRVVWKFAVPPPSRTGRAFIDVPQGSTLLSVGMQSGDMVVWALCPVAAPREEMRRLIVANTGQDVPGFPTDARFLGTAASGGIVWHVWDGDAE